MSAYRTISSTVGKHLKMTVFGGSHEPSVGVRLEGLPDGFTAADIDMAQLQAFLARRAPGSTPYGTARKEADAPVLTSEDPLTFEIFNKDQHSGDYKGLMNTPRPGHADYTAGLRYHGEVNMAGGGPFSGRMTAPLCIAGGIALQILAKKGIKVQAQLVEAGGVQSANVPPEDDPMYQRILAAKADGDSVGGRVRCVVSGMPGGIGGAMYDGLESLLSPIVFGIPGVKGVSFGDGFAVCGMTGSENNDPFCIAPEKAAGAACGENTVGGDSAAVKTATNHAGGILGGISTGMDIIMDVAFKPTPSIAKEQQTVDLAAGKETTLTVGGRHDPCIAVRAVPVVEAAMALGLLDAMLDPSL